MINNINMGKFYTCEPHLVGRLMETRIPIRVYIAGPITLGDTFLNVRDALLAADKVLAVKDTPFVPHMNVIWHLVSPHETKEWLDWDIQWLRVCHVVIRLPGESVGADLEVKEAKRLGIPVLTLEEYLEIRTK